MTTSKILQFSDLHLSPDVPRTVDNWSFCVELVRRERPDLVVLTGDFILDDPDRLDHQTFAFEQLQRLSAPWIATPGNHDIGDSMEDPYQGQSITEARRDRFITQHGGDYWRRDLGDWRIIGINTMLPGSGFTAETEQLNWLKRQSQSDDRPMILFLHKPLCVNAMDEPAKPAWAIPPSGRASILDAVGDANLRIFASGHLHCHRHLRTRTFDMVWAPTTSIVHSAKVSGVGKSTGWIEYTLSGDQIVWTHKTAPELKPIDVTELLSGYGAMRFAPTEVLRAL